MDLFAWIDSELSPEVCDTPRFVYDAMESQSDRCLPLIYVPFDPDVRWHWRDRGAVLDFLVSARCEGGRVLDFGPGDGWPSLHLAPFAREVVSVDGSARRVRECEANARRLGIRSATFLHVSPGEPLPFPDGSFDAVVAAHSVEQTPEPRATLRELGRVLRPGGHLRITYEDLARCARGRERQHWVSSTEDGAALVMYDRDVPGETARQYRLAFSLTEDRLREKIDEGGVGAPSIEALMNIREYLRGAFVCRLSHPSGRTLSAWLSDCGFREVTPTENGQDAASGVYDELLEGERPRSVEEVDVAIRARVEKAVLVPAPIESEPWITAVR